MAKRNMPRVPLPEEAREAGWSCVPERQFIRECVDRSLIKGRVVYLDFETTDTNMVDVTPDMRDKGGPRPAARATTLSLIEYVDGKPTRRMPEQGSLEFKIDGRFSEGAALVQLGYGPNDMPLTGARKAQFESEHDALNRRYQGQDFSVPKGREGDPRFTGPVTESFGDQAQAILDFIGGPPGAGKAKVFAYNGRSFDHQMFLAEMDRAQKERRADRQPALEWPEIKGWYDPMEPAKRMWEPERLVDPYRKGHKGLWSLKAFSANTEVDRSGLRAHEADSDTATMALGMPRFMKMVEENPLTLAHLKSDAAGWAAVRAQVSANAARSAS